MLWRACLSWIWKWRNRCSGQMTNSFKISDDPSKGHLGHQSGQHSILLSGCITEAFLLNFAAFNLGWFKPNKLSEQQDVT